MCNQKVKGHSIGVEWPFDLCSNRAFETFMRNLGTKFCTTLQTHRSIYVFARLSVTKD